jgi:DNA-binding transcriptional LysR family regulator
MIEFNQLEHLVAIAKNKTISKAAEELLISQPGKIHATFRRRFRFIVI